MVRDHGSRRYPGLALVLAVLAGSTGGCTGAIGGAGPDELSRPAGPQGEDDAGGSARVPSDGQGGAVPPAAPGSLLAAPNAYGASGVRRLSREELAQTIQDLTGVDVRDRLDVMPVDPVSTPFDNNYLDQVPSAALLEGARQLADTAAARVLANPSLRDQVVGCRPTVVDDEVCLRRFIETFGRRALRRPLTAEEVTRWVSVRALAVQARSFDAAVEVVLRALLQDVEFLYRVEIGVPAPGTPNMARLTPFEVATRLSYLLWGSAPNEFLLDTAARGGLGSPAEVRVVATAMMTDPRARARLRRLHAMWLSYEQVAAPAPLALAMRAESDALVDRTVAGGSWMELFSATDTFVDTALAAHYGLPAPTGGRGWVPYGSTGRRGLLSHGAVLANGQKFGKTSVVQRGQFVLGRLACKEVPPPPAELKVDVDAEPKGAGACKSDNVRAHAALPACAGCHRTLDGIGFGLEGFDLLGRARTRDETGCAVDGRGEVSGEGRFSGPAELGELLMRSGDLDACFVHQLYEFAVGRPVAAQDGPAVGGMLRAFRAGQHRLPALLLDFVASPPFLHRVLGS